MATTATSVTDLYEVRRGAVDFVDVPELGYLVVVGGGAPESEGFAQAIKALYAVSYGAHFIVKHERGEAGRVMPLEAQWWVDDADGIAITTAVARGVASMADTDRNAWRWRALIMQPAPIDDQVIGAAIERARLKNLPALDRVRLVRWEEGHCAQLLHVGPYADEGPSIVRLHEAIAAAGYRPHGRHHEIYLGDPRRSAPERLRTIVRQPITSF